MFTARMKDLAAVCAFVDRFCADAGVAHGAGLRLNLVVEELFTNTVKHGHRGGSDAPVVITLTAQPDGIRLVYEDQAPPFNPLAYADKFKTAEHVEGGKEGGLGVVLAREMSFNAEYHYLFGHNRISLTLSLAESG
jgi:serine/threonine-protein kinase RsbW